MSVTLSNNENNQSNNASSAISRKRYKHWTDEEEKKLLRLINLKKKKIAEMNDNDWSEIAQKLNVCPQQLYWKAQRLKREEVKEDTPGDNKTSKKDMIMKALSELPS